MSQIRTKEALDEAQKEMIKRIQERREFEKNIDPEKKKIRKAETKQTLNWDQMELINYIKEHGIRYWRRW